MKDIFILVFVQYQQLFLCFKMKIYLLTYFICVLSYDALINSFRLLAQKNAQKKSGKTVKYFLPAKYVANSYQVNDGQNIISVPYMKKVKSDLISVLFIKNNLNSVKCLKTRKLILIFWTRNNLAGFCNPKEVIFQVIIFSKFFLVPNLQGILEDTFVRSNSQSNSTRYFRISILKNT